LKRMQTDEVEALYKRISGKQMNTDQGIVDQINAFKMTEDGNKLPPAPELEMVEGTPKVFVGSLDKFGEASIDPEFAAKWKGKMNDVDDSSLSSADTNHELYDKNTPF